MHPSGETVNWLTSRRHPRGKAMARTRQGGPGCVVTEPISAESWVTLWVTTAGSGETRDAVGTCPQLGRVNVDLPGALGGVATQVGFPW